MNGLQNAEMITHICKFKITTRETDSTRFPTRLVDVGTLLILVSPSSLRLLCRVTPNALP